MLDDFLFIYQTTMDTTAAKRRDSRVNVKVTDATHNQLLAIQESLIDSASGLKPSLTEVVAFVTLQ